MPEPLVPEDRQALARRDLQAHPAQRLVAVGIRLADVAPGDGGRCGHRAIHSSGPGFTDHRDRCVARSPRKQYHDASACDTFQASGFVKRPGGVATMLAFHLATFKIDATPPIGHPLCGGWIKPVVGVDDPLWLRGVVLMGTDRPIVLAALDWTGQ